MSGKSKNKSNYNKGKVSIQLESGDSTSQITIDYDEINAFMEHSKEITDSSAKDIPDLIRAINYHNDSDMPELAELPKMFFLYLLLCERHLLAENYLEFAKTYSIAIKISDELNIIDLPAAIKKIYDTYKEKLIGQLIQEVSKKTQTIYGNDPKLIQSFVEAINFGLDDEPCLIIGETGTGKEIIAKLIHEISHRKDNKFWAVNCGGFTESLFNSDIQGVAPSSATNVSARLGAFLNACGKANDKNNLGYYMHHNKKERNPLIAKSIHCMIAGKDIPDPTHEQLLPLCGTLFLDEINSLPLGLQSNLLRIIQEKEVQVVGEDIKRKYAAKVICATNKQFMGNEASDDFRADLYYRISKGIIFLPALRHMTKSIPTIVKQMINDILSKNVEYEKIKVRGCAIKRLINYHWPGNHRELKNVIYRAIKKLILNSETNLTSEYIDFGISPIEKQIEESFFEGKDLYQVNRKFVDYILNRTGHNKTKAVELGGFRNPKDIHQILKPEEYKTTRFRECKSLSDYL